MNCRLLHTPLPAHPACLVRIMPGVSQPSPCYFRVHFLGKKEEHTCLLMEPPNKGAAAGGASASASGEYAGAQASRLQQQRMPGFVCNLYYDQEASPGEKTLYWLPSRELADDVRADVRGHCTARASLSMGWGRVGRWVLVLVCSRG